MIMGYYSLFVGNRHVNSFFKTVFGDKTVDYYIRKTATKENYLLFLPTTQ
jgi:hypothetical protein